ncbi:efflux RND transporter periplasmic adaptor subunit [Pseudoalteromonas piscicida]|uniref:HlyD family efflux transporter periplasmic adaptor subunit n=1 Tax=Pseudoalteromonas piscicida TaxID=43662 RepID=A0A2A5JMN7_PSEO7|nr:HlyD family efflux transporter periplasmic adaptor subunit [Pseudoalteromonas piscicida]PCK30712.1 hypothetical protein CEX98_16330 [Pseudoalteromonas piscicida]
MDIKSTIDKGAKNKPNKTKYIAIICAVSLLALWGGVGFSSTQKEISPENLWVAPVEQGELVIEVHGFGKLRSKHQQFLTSPTNATVEEVFHRPGSKVTKDDVLLRLANPEMEKLVAKEKLELDRFKAELQEKQITQQREYLNLELDLFKVKTELEKLEARELAERDLVKTGVISEIDYHQTKLSIRQLKKQIEVNTQFLAKLKRMFEESQTAQSALLEQMEANFAAQQRIADRLNVRAGVDGVLQELSVKLGQSTQSGGQLAMVGSTDSLIAELRIPQRSASEVKIGAEAVIDTFGGEARGYVSRIEPIVVDGRILVEIDLVSELPDNAKPELSIEGKVNVATLENAIYLPQPANINEHSTAQLFKLNEDGTGAIKSTVEFGRVAGRLIEVKNGAQRGDRFVVSDVSELTEQSNLKFNKSWDGR